MSKINVNIDDKTGNAEIDAVYEDFDDLISSVSLLTVCLVYRGLQSFNISPEQLNNRDIKGITDLICNIVTNYPSIDNYIEFCESFSTNEENIAYKSMENIYEEWLDTISLSEYELMNLCKTERLDLSITSANKGCVDLNLIKTSDGTIIERITTIKSEAKNGLSSTMVEHAAIQSASVLIVMLDRAFEDSQKNHFRNLVIDDIEDEIFEVYNRSISASLLD